MKVKSFIKYLQENTREDEFSHLNDELSANKKNEARWPEDDYEYDDDSTKDYGDYDDWYDDESTRDNARKSSNPKFDDYDEDDDYYEYDESDDDDDVQHLTYLLRQMFRNSGVDNVHITAKRNEDIVIEVNMAKKDTLRNVIKVFEVANKLKRDILAQYDSEFEMWESKSGGGILTFGFTLEEGLEDDNMPF
jgi:hypothetical protein